jgi:cobalamin biosynthesis protein CobW
MIVLNKADLMDEASIKQARGIVDANRRAATKVVMASDGQVDPVALLGIGAAAEDDLDARPSHHDGVDGEHDHDDFDTFTLAFDAVEDPGALETALKAMVARHDVLRVKGFLEVPGKPMRHVVQGVGGRFDRYFDRPWRDGEKRRSELVVIGLKGLDAQAIAADMGARIV